MSSSSSSSRPSGNSPPWQVVVLVAHHLDPKTLAIASCVCKSWSISMSSDHIWEPLCTTHYPSLSSLQSSSGNHQPRVPYRRLFAVGFTASQRRLRSPSKPRLALHNLLFAVDVRAGDDCVFVSVAKPVHELKSDPDGVFRFDIDVRGSAPAWSTAMMEEARMTWNVVLRGWGGVFTMMECEAKVNFLPGAAGWFSEELPSPGCCTSTVASGLVADLKLGFGESEGVRVETASVGILSVLNWRYVSVDDGLRYLQHFILPHCNDQCYV